jgi:hypothetical protein
MRPEQIALVPHVSAVLVAKCRAHIPAFVSVPGMPADEVRRLYPRFHGICRCGYRGIAYASFQHYVAGDW